MLKLYSHVLFSCNIHQKAVPLHQKNETVKQAPWVRETLKLFDMLPTIALIYDFDGTLAPANMQEFGLLQAIGYPNPNDFWDLCDRIAKTNDAGGISVVMYAIQTEAQRAGIRCT